MTMDIAVLGWGSLIWDPSDLNISGDWHENGPELPVEFARLSGRGRLTLVIHEQADPVQVLWARSAYNELDLAIDNLRSRERTIETYIGYYNFQNDEHHTQFPFILDSIKCWGSSQNVDAAIWTDLPSNFLDKTDHDELNKETVIDVLRNSTHINQENAEEYIRKTPEQVCTSFRHTIEEELGWYSS
jgi:hypothetical protein